MSLFEVQTKTYCGFGITKDVLPKTLTDHAAIIVDPNISIDHFPDFWTPYSCPEGEPTYDGLQMFADYFRDNYHDMIVGIGGGSAMDYTKALAVLYTNPGKAIDYRGFDKVVNPGLPTALIPTTAGTGSEITPNAVFTDTNEKRKLGINGRHMRATYAILDAEWTLTCPYSVALSSLLDAFVHAVESYMSPEATPLTRALSREAFRLLYQNALSIKPPIGPVAGIPQARQNLLYGAYLAAMALSNSGSGVVGAMSYPLGVHFGIPHGYAGGIFLQDIIHHNIERGYDFSELAPSLMGPRHVQYSIGDLWKRLEVPNLKQWIKPEEFKRAEALVFLDAETRAKNPIPLDQWEPQKFVARHL